MANRNDSLAVLLRLRRRVLESEERKLSAVLGELQSTDAKAARIAEQLSSETESLTQQVLVNGAWCQMQAGRRAALQGALGSLIEQRKRLGSVRDEALVSYRCARARCETLETIQNDRAERHAAQLVRREMCTITDLFLTRTAQERDKADSMSAIETIGETRNARFLDSDCLAGST